MTERNSRMSWLSSWKGKEGKRLRLKWRIYKMTESFSKYLKIKRTVISIVTWRVRRKRWREGRSFRRSTLARKLCTRIARSLALTEHTFATPTIKRRCGTFIKILEKSFNQEKAKTSSFSSTLFRTVTLTKSGRNNTRAVETFTPKNLILLRGTTSVLSARARRTMLGSILCLCFTGLISLTISSLTPTMMLSLFASRAKRKHHAISTLSKSISKQGLESLCSRCQIKRLWWRISTR